MEELASRVGALLSEFVRKDAPPTEPTLEPALTRRVYDRLAAAYPASSHLFHTVAHNRALELTGIKDGSRVLEVATGSGEMFRQLVSRNRSGYTAGLDYSPNMASSTQRKTEARFPGARFACQAGDARSLPYRDGAFDAVFACYLLELLPADGIVDALAEFHRVLTPGGKLALTLIGKNSVLFNAVYVPATKVIPHFVGRQVEEEVSDLLSGLRFKVLHDVRTRQTCYPSRVIVAQTGRPS